jgi:epoxyqueuosine reductase
MNLREWVKARGREIGFSRVGIAPAGDLPELAGLSEWLERGYGGEMAYLRDPRRRDVRHLMPAARSVICCALAYDTPHTRSTELPRDPERGWLSRYAWGRDYHGIVREKLEALHAALAERAGPGFESRAYVDTGPVLERVYAKHAGLGWQGKNTCLLDSEMGSFFFLGVLLTNLELAPDSPLPDGCGSCTLCLEACPTGALVEPYLMDARRCISYLTIELRGAIPEEFREPMGRHVFGCDICQDVCPYNQRAWLTEVAAFRPQQLDTEAHQSDQPPSPARPEPVEWAASATGHGTQATGHESLFHPRLEWLASLTEADFRRIFRASAVKRTRWRGLLRNVLVAMGNSGHRRFCPLLERFAASDDELLSAHARWALARLQQS